MAAPSKLHSVLSCLPTWESAPSPSLDSAEGVAKEDCASGLPGRVLVWFPGVGRVWYVPRGVQGRLTEEGQWCTHAGQGGIFGSAPTHPAPSPGPPGSPGSPGAGVSLFLGGPDTHPSLIPPVSHSGLWAPVDT